MVREVMGVGYRVIEINATILEGALKLSKTRVCKKFQEQVINLNRSNSRAVYNPYL
jgi:hypothetical protein